MLSGRAPISTRSGTAQASSRRIAYVIIPLHAVKLLIHLALLPWIFCSLN